MYYFLWSAKIVVKTEMQFAAKINNSINARHFTSLRYQLVQYKISFPRLFPESFLGVFEISRIFWDFSEGLRFLEFFEICGIFCDFSYFLRFPVFWDFSDFFSDFSDILRFLGFFEIFYDFRNDFDFLYVRISCISIFVILGISLILRKKVPEMDSYLC